MRLIDADALKEQLIKERDAIPLTKTERYGFGVEFPDPHGMSMRGGINKAFRCMEKTPTIDAVPVVRCDSEQYRRGFNDGIMAAAKELVRCKDCRHFYYDTNKDPSCSCIGGLVSPEEDDFCSYGERRSDD